MAYVPKEGGGSLFKNDKQGNDKRPDWRGDLMIGGQLYEIAAWEKQGARGAFFSLSAKPKQADKAQKPAARDHADDDVPF
jgi:hypothetical protein